MAWIQIIDEQHAKGTLVRIYRGTRKRAGRAFNIFQCIVTPKFSGVPLLLSSVGVRHGMDRTRRFTCDKALVLCHSLLLG